MDPPGSSGPVRTPRWSVTMPPIDPPMTWTRAAFAEGTAAARNRKDAVARLRIFGSGAWLRAAHANVCALRARATSVH